MAAFAITLGGRDDGSIVSLLWNPRTLAAVLRYTGLGDWSVGLGAMLASTVGLGCCLVAPYLMARVSARAGGTLRAAAVAGAALIPVFVLWQYPPETVLRGVPLLIAIALGDAVVRFARRPAERSEREPEIVLLAFAVGALARIPFSAGAYHYGFYLLPVPLAALVVVAFRRVPGLPPGGAGSERLLAVSMAATIATLCWTHLRASAAMFCSWSDFQRARARSCSWSAAAASARPARAFASSSSRFCGSISSTA